MKPEFQMPISYWVYVRRNGRKYSVVNVLSAWRCPFISAVPFADVCIIYPRSWIVNTFFKKFFCIFSRFMRSYAIRNAMRATYTRARNFIGKTQMIKWKLDVVKALRDKGYSGYYLSKNKLLSTGTIDKLNKRSIGIELSVLNKLCILLECQPSDLLVVETDCIEAELYRLPDGKEGKKEG